MTTIYWKKKWVIDTKISLSRKRYEPRREKAGLWGFRPGPVQSLKKPGSLKWLIKEEEDLSCPCSENKCAVQLCSNCTADLRLWFRIYKDGWFSGAVAQIGFWFPSQSM